MLPFSRAGTPRRPSVDMKRWLRHEISVSRPAARRAGRTCAGASAEGAQDPAGRCGRHGQPRQSPRRLQRQSGTGGAAQSSAEAGERQHPDADRHLRRRGKRKLPDAQGADDAIAYAPRKDFTGVDAVELEIDTDNRVTLLSYRITVSAQTQAQPLWACRESEFPSNAVSPRRIGFPASAVAVPRQLLDLRRASSAPPGLSFPANREKTGNF
jgi:hypothetical protein